MNEQDFPRKGYCEEPVAAENKAIMSALNQPRNGPRVMGQLHANQERDALLPGGLTFRADLDPEQVRAKINPTTDDVLKERGNRYGEFPEHARITQNIKRVMVDSPNWAILADDIKETLEMIAHKIGRVLNGDPEYPDNFTDIAGYSRLIEKRLLGIKIDGRKNA